MSGLILASRSAARARMLADAGITFEVAGAGVDEEAAKRRALSQGQDPRTVAMTLAEAKGLAVSRERRGLVIGADQTLDLDGRLFDKPLTLAAAGEQLRQLRGRDHQLHAAVVLCRGAEVVWRTVGTVRLRMRTFSETFLSAYLAAEGEALLGCVGAYRLEAMGAQLFDHIDGDYFTVLGLPLLPLLAALRDLGEAAA